jgi:hypothetical protein
MKASDVSAIDSKLFYVNSCPHSKILFQPQAEDWLMKNYVAKEMEYQLTFSNLEKVFQILLCSMEEKGTIIFYT